MAQRKRSAGEVLDGRYRLTKRLGRGGFGDVWRAEELLPDGSTLRDVALKLLHGSVASSPDWSAEARIIASLRHPALVTVYAAGLLQADRPIPFVAMELLIGDNLGDLLQEGAPIRWRRALHWAREAAAALDVIHAAGVVHLDLKPANLFLADGAIKVLDFGIARQGRDQGAATVPASDPVGDEMSTAAFMIQHAAAQPAVPSGAHSGGTSRSVVGTPGFMAPEIFEEGEASPATDAYALAACVVQLTTGRLPQAVTGKPPTVDPSTTVGAWFAEVQAATVRGRIRSLGTDHPDLPPALVALLERWLALDPTARDVDPGGLRAALDAVWACPYGWKGNPYRGLEPHRLQDEGKLFGRDADIARIGRELVDQAGVVLYGDAAIGLTSLATAGIVPELARHFADGKHDWVCCPIRLTPDDPDATVVAAVRQHLELHEVTVDDDDPVDRLCSWAIDANVGTVLFIDDMERLDSEDDAPLLVGLMQRVADGVRGLRVVATLDAAHVSALSQRDAVGGVIRPWLRFIGPIQAAAVTDLVLGPARAVGHEHGAIDGIIEELQAELRDDGTRLSIISLALEHWWRTEAPTAGNWQDVGGLIGCLCDHANAVFERFDAREKSLADTVLLRTLSVDGTSAPVEESSLYSALDSSLDGSDESAADADRLRRVIDRLVEARLVMRQEGHLRLAHIGLAKAWPRLADLRLHDIDRLTFLEDLRNAARRWALSGRLRKHVWPPDMMRALERRRGDVAGELGEAERAFVDASRRARRLGWIARGLVAAVCLLTLGAGYLVNARSEAREAAQHVRLEHARRVAALGRMVTASRRTSDPYHRVALLSGAIDEGSSDPMLSLELLEAARELPVAEFMSLGAISRPDFMWGERWLVGASRDALVIFDFAPPAGEAWAPLAYRFRPHLGQITDVIALPFDTSVLTRDQLGAVKIWRLRESGQVALAASAPEACEVGPVRVAAAAPVVACTTPHGVVRWDLRRPTEMTASKFDGRVLDVSADGEWIVAAHQKTLLLWNATTSERREITLEQPPSVARVSPREALVAVVFGLYLDVYELTGQRLVRREVLIPDPVAARWADSGLDVAVCDNAGFGEWHYLRRGKRADGDPLPPMDPKPCETRVSPSPEVLHDESAFAFIGGADIGPRITDGGWRRDDGVLVTRDLVLFDPTADELRNKLLIKPQASSVSAESSARAVFKDGDGSVWQVGEHIRQYDSAGAELGAWQGQLLTRCPNGRLLAWRNKDHAEDASAWEIFAARVDVVLQTVERRPGNVIGADPDCQRVVFQWLTGELVTIDLDKPGASPEPLEHPGGGFAVAGYVFDARPSRARGTRGAGLWLASSSGAMNRLDGVSGELTAYGHAAPRATAMADGPRGNELLFADDRGVVLRSGEVDRVVLGPLQDRQWEDIVVGLDLKTAWLSSSHGVTVIDLDLGDVLGELEVHAHDRLAPWDDGGSLLLWPYSYKGPPKGQVLPISQALARDVGRTASNIRAQLGADMRAVIRLDD